MIKDRQPRRERIVPDYCSERYAVTSLLAKALCRVQVAGTKTDEPWTKETIRFMRIVSMVRKILADMIEEEARNGLDSKDEQKRYVANHQQYNDEWYSCFRHMDIGDYTGMQIFEQLFYEMALVAVSPEYPGTDAIVPSQRDLHEEIEAARRARRKAS